MFVSVSRMQENDGLLDVVVGDGGFGVSGEENLQEYYSRQLFLCQSTVALSVLRPGGSYMCKLFDMFLDGTIGTIYILWRCFRKVCIFKPHASRPANSEVSNYSYAYVFLGHSLNAVLQPVRLLLSCVACVGLLSRPTFFFHLPRTSSKTC